MSFCGRIFPSPLEKGRWCPGAGWAEKPAKDAAGKEEGRGLSPSLRSRAPRLACGRSSLRVAPRRRVLGAAAPLWCPWSYSSAPCRAVPTQLCGRRRCADGGTLPAPAARGHRARGRARSGLQPGPVAWVRFPLALRGFAAEKLPTSFEIMRCYADFSLIIFQCVIV